MEILKFLGKKLFFTEKLIKISMIKKIRVSIGSASVLGLVSKQFPVPPTTCYIMTYNEGHCVANCGFCPQARESKSSIEKLSRITWPIFLFNDFLTKLKYMPPSKKFKRICIQTLNYKENFKDIREIITQIKSVSNIYISIAIICYQTRKRTEDKITHVGLTLLLYSMISMILFYVMVLLDNILIVFFRHPGYSEFQFASWIFALIFIILSYFSLVMPEWLVKRIKDE